MDIKKDGNKVLYHRSTKIKHDILLISRIGDHYLNRLQILVFLIFVVFKNYPLVTVIGTGGPLAICEPKIT
jgi:hypothetical protein